MRNDVLSLLFKSRFWKDIKTDFVNEAKKANTKKELLEFANKWQFYLYFDSSSYTLKNRSRDMRKELSLNGISEDIVNLFKLPSEIYVVMNEQDSSKTEEVLRATTITDFNYQEFTTNNIKRLIGLIESNSIEVKSNNANLDREKAYYQLVVLAMATGRRQIELLKTLELSKKKDNAIYSGLVKKKNDGISSVEAPILMDISIAKRYLKEIRSVFESEKYTNAQINSKFNGSIGKSLSRIFNDDEIKDFHFFRTCYAETCYSKFGGASDKEAYFAGVLGHEYQVSQTAAYIASGKKGID